MPRVIAGTARGLKLRTLAGEMTRPTADRTKEAIFSSLGYRVEGAHVLDLCAGSGQLGIEALSRGAARVHFVDQANAACRVIRQNLETTRFTDRAELSCRDVLQALRQLQKAGQVFDLVFFDPPYKALAGLLHPVSRALAEGLLAPDGRFIVEESSRDVSDPEGGPLVCVKRSTYGAAAVTFFAHSPSDAVLE